MPRGITITFCTCPDQESANRIAQALVERELAACVNILPAVSSVYQWQGQVETSSEALLLIKTAANRYPDLEQAIRALHPYELPEIVTVPVQDGLQPYLDWVEQCTYKSV